MASPKTVIEVAGREVTVSNPQKVYFPRTGHTKLDLVRYYLAVADGALHGAAGRPMALKRFVNGAEEEPFFQKRAPSSRPSWIETAELRFPSGRTADEVVLRDAAGLAWVANLGCIDLNPHPVRASDLDHPDELRAELEPLVTTFAGHPWDWGAHVAAATDGAGVRTPRSSEYSRWNVGKDLSFVPLRPERVVEVRYDHMEGTRFRHTAQFVRWRPDRSPDSCTFAQLEEPVSYSLAEILGKI